MNTHAPTPAGTPANAKSRNISLAADAPGERIERNGDAFYEIDEKERKDAEKREYSKSN